MAPTTNNGSRANRARHLNHLILRHRWARSSFRNRSLEIAPPPKIRCCCSLAFFTAALFHALFTGRGGLPFFLGCGFSGIHAGISAPDEPPKGPLPSTLHALVLRCVFFVSSLYLFLPPIGDLNEHKSKARGACWQVISNLSYSRANSGRLQITVLFASLGVLKVEVHGE